MELLGVRFPDPLSSAGRLARGIAGLALTPLDWLPGQPPRRAVWSCPGRLYVLAHGVHGPGGERVARRIERALNGHPGVRWARVNAPTARVIIELSDPPPKRAALIGLIARAESEPVSEDEQTAEEELHHPADGTHGTRLRPTLAVDAASLVLSAVNRVTPWAPLPPELSGLVSAIKLHPDMRRRSEQRLHGHERAESTMSMVTALAHALTARGAGTVLDIVTRGAQWREARAHERAWCAAEGELIGGPDQAAAAPVVVERPCPLPEEPVDRYARRATAAGAAAAAVSAPFAGLRRAAAVGLAALPKAPDVGQAAFAAQLGMVLARRGTLVMDRAVLRRMDLVDVVVVDTRALATGAWHLSDLVPLPGSDSTPLSTMTSTAFALFDPAEPDVVRRDGEWALGPVDDLALAGRKGVRERRRLHEHGAGAVLGLARGRRLEAVLAIEEQIAPGVNAITAAAHDAGLRVVTVDQETTARAAAEVRRLQADGHVVLVVSAGRQALGAADCGVGLHRAGAAPPWGAHLLVGQDLDAAVLAVEAVTAARQVSRDAIMLAKAATGIGAVTALSTRSRPAASSLHTVDTAAALAFVDGTWRARQLRSARPTAEPTGRSAPPWHLMPTDVVLARLGTDQHGLTEGEARRRLPAEHGADIGGVSLGKVFLAELANPLTPVLAGGAAVSAAVGSPVDAALVVAITGVSALVGSIQQTHTERALASLYERSAVSATVIRDSTRHQKTADRLVAGDVVAIDAGDVVPADCRLLRTTGLEVDESSLTGESLPVAKDPAPVVATEIAERGSMLYEGTTISTGHALAVVVATGEATEAGRGMAAARHTAPTTGVEARLASFTKRSLPLALGSAASVAGAGLLHGVPLRESLGAAVNLAVASVPEGLPFLVNAAQLAAARRLAEHGALVSNPRTIEALGRVDVLCFDKTGTLTQGTLAVSTVDDGRRAADLDSLHDSHRAVLAAALRATPQADHPEKLTHHTDRAVTEGAHRAGVRADMAAGGWRKADTVPFEPSRGYHATVGRADKHKVLSVKGAPEVVLPRCSHYRDNSSAHAVDTAARARLRQRMERLAGSGQRVLAVAERRISTVDATEMAVDELCLLGFIALADPVRDSAAPATSQLHDAGVHTVMITGDHPATGEAVAGRVNGGADDLTVITGTDIDELDDRRLDELLPTVDVIARCSPAQKVRIIQAYQRTGRVVAMTGDGANDAPAIRLADVGIALGRRGTPAARAAADLVVTDDRLETIIAALVEGRAMWASVREALAILLGGNLGEIAFTVLGSALTGRSPLTARQLLLVNLLTDLAPALAIALSQPSRGSVTDLLREGPGTSLGRALTRDIATRAVATTLGPTVAWTAARLTGRARRASTVALAALVGTQLTQTLIAGSRDPTVLAAGLGSALLLAAVIQTPGVSQFFGCTPLGPVAWTIALGSAAAAGSLSLVLSPTTDGTIAAESDHKEEP